MDEHELSVDTNISLTLPIRIGYDVLEDFINAKFAGEIISKDNDDGKVTKYAKILEIGLTKSSLEGHNLQFTIKLETLTFLYRNKELEIIVDAFLDFNPELQTVFIQKYEIDSKGKSWVADQLLESVMNKFIYQKVIRKLNFELMPIINEQLKGINTKLAARLEAKEGIYITGNLQQLQISHLEAKDHELWILMSLAGWGVIDLENLDFN